ncbi:MAG: hypothetical protein GF329_15640 [Candidatus Lokiarchaeota archaeon]|nr:hypothetical protein [Candidatus Lokiarchaeota archaeon]
MKKEEIISFLKNIRLLPSISFMLMYFFGWYFSNIFNLFDLILGLISVFFTWQFCISLNDIFDVEIDRISNPDRPYVKGLIEKKKYIIISIVICTISIITILFVDIISMVFIILFLILGYMYSAPPFRLRKYLIGTLFIGAASALSYFSGIFSGVFILNWYQLMIGILIFVALSMGTVVKDYKDYEGDKNQNIKTIFTKFGLEKGIKIATILLIITFLLPFLLINHPIDFIIIIPITIVVAVLFNYKKIKKKMQVTMVFFFIEILYVFLRITEIIIF